MNSAQTRGVENLASNNSRFCGSKASSREKWISPSVFRASLAVATKRNIEHKNAKTSSISCRQINHNQGKHQHTRVHKHRTHLNFSDSFARKSCCVQAATETRGYLLQGHKPHPYFRPLFTVQKRTKIMARLFEFVYEFITCVNVSPSRHRRQRDRGRATKLDLGKGVIQGNTEECTPIRKYWTLCDRKFRLNCDLRKLARK